MLLVQKFLENNSLESLKKNHGINFNLSTNNKFGLNYDQLNSSGNNLFTHECRGLVLRSKNDFKTSSAIGETNIVAFGLKRFFNMEQKELAADIDWKTAAYEEKMDGSLLIVYWDDIDNAWHCGTRGRCEADADAHDCGMTFRKLFDSTVSKLPTINSITFDHKPDINSLMQGCDKGFTYVFELTTPLNRIVCRYDDFNLTLLAVRNNKSLEECDPSKFLQNFHPFIIKNPKLYKFDNIDHMIQVVRDWNPEFHEGVVIKDALGNRVKVKNPAYVAFNHLNASLSTSLKGCVEVILLGKEDDIIHMMPDVIANRIKKLKPIIAQVMKRAEDDYNRIKRIDDKKSFAMEAQKCFWPASMFALKNGKTNSLKEFSLGNKLDQSKLPKPAIENMLLLCKKIDPTIEDLL